MTNIKTNETQYGERRERTRPNEKGPRPEKTKETTQDVPRNNEATQERTKQNEKERTTRKNETNPNKERH